jgi:CheY-specific phosphatase CheX
MLPTMRSRIAKLFVDAVTEFMQSMAELGCTVTPVAALDRCEGLLSGVVTLSGDVTGQVAVSFRPDSAAGLVARLMGVDASKLDRETLCDGVGEIANVIAGNASGGLSQLGFELRLSLPSAVFADNRMHSFEFEWTTHYEVSSSLGTYQLSVWLNLA